MLGKWLVKASPGKLTRLAFICDVLGLEQHKLPHDLYYQLLHRTASAVIEAKRFKTDAAAMLVHSFSPSNQWFDAFALFAKQFGFEAEPGKLMLVGPDAKPPLYLGWVCGDLRFLTAREIDSVYKIIELVGTSADSWEKAAHERDLQATDF